MRYRSQKSLIPLVSLVLLFVSAALVDAQSGRRQSRPASPVPVVPEEPKASPPVKTETKEPTSELIIGIEQGGGFDFIPLYYYNTVLRSCAARLEAAPGVSVSVSQGDVNRSKSISRAKAEQSAHVILLQLRTDRIGADRNSDNGSDIVIEYLVLAPTTAKVVTSGRAYQRGYRRGGVIMQPPTGRTNGTYTDYMLQEAAKDAAQRILSALHLGAGGRTLP